MLHLSVSETDKDAGVATPLPHPDKSTIYAACIKPSAPLLNGMSGELHCERRQGLLLYADINIALSAQDAARSAQPSWQLGLQILQPKGWRHLHPHNCKFLALGALVLLWCT